MKYLLKGLYLMFRLNNKGQSLVMFIIIIPILALLLTLVYDVGIAIYEKNSLSNTCFMVIDYGLDNIDSISENELTNLIMRNTNDLSYMSLDVQNNNIKIILKKEVKGVIGRMFGFDLVEVNTQYEGSIIDYEKRIERIK